MKAKRFLFRAPVIFGTPLKVGVPVFIGFTFAISGLTANAGDILRGGSPRSNKPTRASGGTPTPAATDAARANAKDTLARTSKTLADIRNLQNAARNAAIRNSANNLGKNPNRPNTVLPRVPNGIAIGGLNPTADPTKWTGANNPVQTVKNGKTTVTIKQTTQQALLEWQTMNVGKKTTLNFDQSKGGADSGKWIAFNQIKDTSGNPTQILGKIKAQGQVYMINTNGIIFGGSSQVNAKALTASSLPITTKMIERGLLTNPDVEFLFDGLGKGKMGDVTVQAGARITSPVDNDGNGGRVFLAGANVTNEGTISTRAGQTILAAGLQVGILAHASNDPSIRGLDVVVGAVTDPASTDEPYAGTATNSGIIESARGNVTITGKDVRQAGVIESSTSVSLNGTVNLLANYGAIRNAGYRATDPATGSIFNFTSSGTVTLAEGSLTRILPEYGSKDKVTGTELALRSRIDVQGKSIYMGKDAEIFAPNAKVSLKAGEWQVLDIGQFASFLHTTGQVYLDTGARINLAGTVDAEASFLQNYLTVTLRGSELSVAPLQRDSVLRGNTIVVDITKMGTYNGNDWVGTPLADLRGYLGLIERDISQLTTAGGSLDIAAGGSVVIRKGSNVDVSGGWTNFTGGNVRTSRLITADGRLIDVDTATPDQVYRGIFNGTSTFTSAKWGKSETFNLAIAPTGEIHQNDFLHGANAGGISITSPSLALDGDLKGTRVSGPRQVHSSGGSKLPSTGSLTIKLQSQIYVDVTDDADDKRSVYNYMPTNPDVIFGAEKQGDVLDFDPDSLVLESEREGKIFLSESLVSDQGFGNLTIVNERGNIVVPEKVTLKPGTGSTFSLTGANVDVLGKIISPGSTLSFKAITLTSYEEAVSVEATPPANPGRGVLTLGSSAVLDTSGFITDGRTLGENSLKPVVLRGGTVNLIGYSADLKAGAKVDVSGGFLLDSSGKQTYGDGGTINIEGGVNPGAKALGGFLNLESTLSGYSGAKGGTLNIQAPHIQIGGSTAGADTLLLDPSYFSKGGFSTFKLTGLGIGEQPGVLVTAGTRIKPVVKSLEAVVPPLGDGKISLGVIQKLPSERSPVSFTLASPGVSDRQVRERGDVIIEEGAVIRTDPGGSVTVTGTVVSVLGSIVSQGGTITVGGGSSSGIRDNPVNAIVTTFIGSGARLDASGTVIRTPDDFGRKTGRVLAGGNITLTGNISASAGAVLDVSGASASLDINPDNVIPTKSHPAYNGLNNIPLGIASDRVKVDSNGGRITLRGSESLSSNATLIGHAGGSTALGGNLVVSSGAFNAVAPPPSQFNLTVTQEGTLVTNGLGEFAESGGRFIADSFTGTGFDALALNGVVLFDGDVTINAGRELSVASDSFLHANGKTVLTAPHVILGSSAAVVLPEKEVTPFSDYSSLPTYGAGNLEVNADLIDLGHLSFQQIGKITLNAGKGDIRGSGTVQSAGDLVLSAGHIYPNTASKLTFVNYDYQDGGVTREGSITVTGNGTKSLPLSAGGTLSLYSSNIVQNGTLRAPFGTINLGWDGTGTRPVDILAGSTGGNRFPVTKKLTLGSSSVTSVSAVDPITGKGITIPYGVSTNGENWIDPRGVDITSTGAPQKNIILQGGELVTESGSLIDLKGGGDLYAYRWIEGLGGPSDILATTGGFAVIAGYSAEFAPVSEYNAVPYSTTNPNLIDGYTGYTNASLKVGDRIYLNGSKSLPAGFYTLLPARYALLPGAVLVTPTGGTSSESYEMPDKSSVVSGYRYNSLIADQDLPGISTRFEIASSKVVRERAEYTDFLASVFMKNGAPEDGVAPRLPSDSGHLVFQAQQAMELLGGVLSESVSKGRGSTIDISTTLDTLITSSHGPATPGVIQLDSSILGSFGAESLLIGGRRTTTAESSVVTVNSGSVTVDNAGSTLAARDLVIVSKGGITLAEGSSLASTGKLSGAENLLLSGNGTLVRVSADKGASVLRSNITAATSPLLTIGSGVDIKGGGIILDSSAGVSLSADASLSADSYQFAAGNIAVILKNPGTVSAGPGLVVSNALLGNLQSASSLKLLSYGSIDLYGTGTFGSVSGLDTLSLSAGQIRGLNTDGGTARIAAGTVRLENTAAIASSVSNGSFSGDLEIVGNRIELGENQIAINGYSSVLLDSSTGIIGEGTGGLSVQGDLTAKTPVLAGAVRANRTITAKGSIVLQGASRNGSAPVISGLGSSLSVTGDSVTVNTEVSLPSGSLKFNALSGDLTVKSTLDVSGRTRKFHDIKKVTSAGSISLTAGNGDVILDKASKLDLSSPASGGNGGNLSISTPKGKFSLEGVIFGSGGKGGKDGGFFLDVLSLPSLEELTERLSASGLTEIQRIRVRSGNVLVKGTATARDFGLVVDQGNIRVTGTVDASGKTGGDIRLAAHGDVKLEDGSLLTVAGKDFSNAGKVGSVTLESGSSLNGVAGTGSVSILEGSKIDLSVASKVDGDASTPGSSAYLGKFSGKLHIRAPRTTNNDDLLVDTLAGTIIGASSILVEGYKVYDLTSSGGTITGGVQTSIRTDATDFLGAAGTRTENYDNIIDRLLDSNPDLADNLVLAPGAEIVNRTGDLVLGTSSSTTTSDWNLSTFRFGEKGAAGVLTLRSAGDLVFYNALSDGFSPTLTSGDVSWLWTARLASRNPLLPQNQQSWSYRLTAGADLSSADFAAVLPTSSLVAGKGTLKLGKNATNLTPGAGPGANVTTLSAIANRFQVIRTGSGDIDINTARDIQLLNQFATIYTAGTAVADPTLGDLFKFPNITTVNSAALGSMQQEYAVQYSSGGGNVTLNAGGNIERLTLVGGQLVADSQYQMPTNWLYKRGYVGTDGLFGADREDTSTSTTWWVDFSNFFQGVGALGGGDVTLTAGKNISNVDAVIPTNARMPGYKDSTQTERIAPDASRLIEIGGGDLLVHAGNNIDAGVYYVERGDGVLSAGSSIVTNATRSVLTSTNQASIHTQLPTTLFLGKGSFDVSATGDLLLGPVANPFLLPGGQLNSYLNKSYFSTYGADSEVTVSSVGGTVTLKTKTAQSAGFEEPFLYLWYRNKLLLAGSTTAFSAKKPWLRLSERDVIPFSSLFSLQPSSVSAISFSGDVNLAGGLVLSPSPRGNVGIFASGSINALQPNGVLISEGVTSTFWGNATINLSDADPAAIPGIANPFGYQGIGGTTATAAQTQEGFLDFIKALFLESGDTLGSNVTLQTKQLLHGAGPLHRGDTEPLRLYAGEGDISGLTLFSPKVSRVIAGRDISDISFYIQNLSGNDTSVVSSGRDILPYNTLSELRQLASTGGNVVSASSGIPRDGDIQISGPGTLEVLAGRNLDLGVGPNNPEGTGVGITSIGNTRNPYLPDNGANLVIGAGLGLSLGLADSNLHIAEFIDTYVDTKEGAKYLKEIAPDADFGALSSEEQARLAVEVFYRILRDAGRDYLKTGKKKSYKPANEAIKVLFGEDPDAFVGEILTRSRDIRTANGGDISMLTPGGGITLASSTTGNTLAPPGIVTAAGGNIGIFAKQSVSIGIGRIFTLRGGDEIIWSTKGDIAAGSSSKTVQTASPTRVRIDPQSAAVQTDLSGLATGGGIGVLNTVKGVEPGDVDLIAPEGTVDAGDAGIRVSGNLNIAANQVLNSANISVSGNSSGASAPSVSSPSVSGLTAASNSAATTTNSTTAPANEPPREQMVETSEVPSIITVEVIGYGGGSGEEEDEENPSSSDQSQ
ncbi:MAG: filamentous hemagglutinin N-terminal domain-containing protein [Verrucomicrobiaceae bacterium]|nr:MAG: filamentous hemagglutinin N-terminal domain-containing protein [Verrucomicrobiaceae bacterium]